MNDATLLLVCFAWGALAGVFITLWWSSRKPNVCELVGAKLIDAAAWSTKNAKFLTRGNGSITVYTMDLGEGEVEICVTAHGTDGPEFDRVRM